MARIQERTAHVQGCWKQRNIEHQCILQDVLDIGDILDDWNHCKLPKKGNLGDCNNWRGITHLSITSRVFSHIIHQCIAATVDTLPGQEQGGFQYVQTCIALIFVLWQILKQSHEWNSLLYVVFVDFEKEFSSLHCARLWKFCNTVVSHRSW